MFRENIDLHIIDRRDGNSILWVSLYDTLTEQNFASMLKFVADSIYELRKLEIFGGKTVIIRDGVNEKSLLSVDYFLEAVKPFLRRIGCDHVNLLYIFESNTLVVPLNINVDEFGDLENLSNWYICSLLEDKSSHYKLTDGSRFELPSKMLSNIFVRVGNIQKNVFVLDNMFLFLYNTVLGARTILVETWSISTLCYHIASRLKSRGDASEVAVLFLSSYFDGSEDCEEEFRKVMINSYIRDELPLVMLFSATLTGESWGRIEERMKDGLENHSDLRVISIVSLSSHSAVRSLAQFKLNTEKKISKDVDIQMPINKRTYFPDFIEPKIYSIMGFLSSHKEFFERYSSKGIFRVHANSHSSQSYSERHNAFYVKFDVMVETECFRLRLHQKLASVSRPAALIYLDTLSNRRMAELVESYYEASIVRVCASKFDGLKGEIRKSNLDSLEGRIWILDSIVVSGDTIGEYGRIVRECLFDGTQVSILIGLHRPSSVKSFQSHQNGLEHITGKGEFHSVEQVVLPNWGSEKCPWCKELKYTQKGEAASDVNTKRNIVARRHRLSNSIHAGLENDLFLFEADRVEPQTFQLTPGSYFLDTSNMESGDDPSEADVTCCVGSVAQQWRTDSISSFFRQAAIDSQEDGERALTKNVPIGATTFTDPILRAAIWRVFQSQEIIPHGRGNINEYYEKFSQIIEKKSTKSFNCLSVEAMMLLKNRIKNIDYDVSYLSNFEREIAELMIKAVS
jgi:hypothetical protein